MIGDRGDNEGFPPGSANLGHGESLEGSSLRFDDWQTNQQRIHLLEIELRRIRKEASAARLDARAAEIELMIRRDKRGLGSAIVDAMKYAVAKGYRMFANLDADDEQLGVPGLDQPVERRPQLQWACVERGQRARARRVKQHACFYNVRRRFLFKCNCANDF